VATIYTIGHSKRSFDEFLKILQRFKIDALIDIRTLPGSKHNPQYNLETLSLSLIENGIEYYHFKDLGGLRKARLGSVNGGWEDASFRGYADYMQTEKFEEALKNLLELAKRKVICIMCAEAVPWRCHRSLVGDALLARKIDVIDIFNLKNSKPHRMTSFAKQKGPQITYPL
jgi:uncharacterized protein (DUF488 family)